MRSRKFILATLLILILASSAVAQKQAPPKAKTVSQVLEFWISDTERQVVPAAEAMPQAKYSFAPTNGEFQGARTFAEQVKHLAAANYQLGTGALGELPPAGTQDESAPPSVHSKAEIVEYLKGSFALSSSSCRRDQREKHERADHREGRPNSHVAFN